MATILHLFEDLELDNAHAIIAAAKWSTRQHEHKHIFLTLKPANPQAIFWAREAGIEVIVAPDAMVLDAQLESADIIQIEYTNTPAINTLLRQPLPPARLAIWSHIEGLHVPQILPQAVANMADACIASASSTLKTHAAFISPVKDEDTLPSTWLAPPADFSLMADFERRPHEGFNIGVIVDNGFADLHPQFISMCAEASLPEITFIVCGENSRAQLEEEVATLGLSNRFDFIEDKAEFLEALELMDVFGLPMDQPAISTAQTYLQLALFAGIPSVVLDLGETQQFIKHNETGFLATSPEDYVRTLQFLHNNPTECRRIGLNASIYARTHLGAQNAAGDLNKLYESLLELPKRFHIWDGAPTQVGDVDTPNASYKIARQLIDALDAEGLAFEISLGHPEIVQQITAEKTIATNATTSPALFDYLQAYANHAPTDPLLKLWIGLALENQEAYTEAIAAYAAAMEIGLDHWRVQWYLGRALYKNGKTEEAARVYATLRSTVVDFDEVTGDTLFAEEANKTLEFSISGANININAQADSKIRVSAIVSTYASEAFIDGCLHDLVSQSLFQDGELEIIVVDAHSPENEKDIVTRYQEHFDNIHYVRTPAREPLYVSWNRGIKLASGKYITSANTDDRHRKDALEVMANYLDAHPEFALLYAGQIDTSVPNESFEASSSNKILNWPDYTYAELERHCIIGSQPMWRRAMHEKYGYFREDLVSAGDYEFWLRIGRHENFFRYPETLGLYFRNPEGIEHGAVDSERETMQIWQEYGMFERGVPVILRGRVIKPARTPQFTPPVSTAQPVRPAFDTYITRFEIALNQNDLVTSLQVAEEAIKSYAELPYPFILKAIVLMQQADYPGAFTALEQSIQIDETPEALVELIQLSIATGQEEDAQRTIGYLEQQYPDWKQRIENIKNKLMQDNTASAHGPARLEDLDFSISSFEELKVQFEQLLHLKDMHRAEVLAKTAILKFPDNHEAWVMKATTDRLNGSYEDAREAIHKSLLIEDSPEALIELFQVSQALGDDEEAQNIASMFDVAYPDFSAQFKELFPNAVV